MRIFGALMVMWLGMASWANAAPPLEVYGRLPAIDFVALSPSGSRFALASRDGENRTLVVRRTDGQSSVATKLGPGKVRDLRWGGDRHLFVLGSSTIYAPVVGLARQEWLGGAHIDLEAKKSFALLAGSRTYVQALFGWYGERTVGGQDYLYVGAYTFEQMRPTYNPAPEYASLVRINLESGKPELVAKAVGGRTDWLLDTSGEILVRGVVDPRGRQFRLFAGPQGGEAMLVSPIIQGGAQTEFRGLGRSADKLLLLESTDDDVLLKEVSLSVSTTPEVLSRGDNTVSGIFDRESNLLIGLDSQSSEEVRLFDPALQRKVVAARKAWPGTRSTLISYSRNFDQMVFVTTGDQDSGTYWLVDIAKKSAVPIGRVNPDIPDASVGSSRYFTYKAADGLEMNGVLTLPPGNPGKGLPLVVMPHGGPIVQGDAPGFDWWAQAFASRGYAVFQPNYRGTLGRGEAFRKAALGEFGRKMQTDISDGVEALARDGIIDPKRSCIVGASYGGYAALAGVTLQQGLYRCAVSVAGLSDLPRFKAWIDERDGSDTRSVSFWRALTGATKGQDLTEISPQRLAARADAPVLLIHGADDTVVPIEQSRVMQKALAAAGKPVEFITMPGEDHWLSTEVTRQAMLKAAVAFVETHNPPQ